MSKIDIIILFFLLVCAWLGYRYGIVRMGMALTGIVFSVLILSWKWDEVIFYFYSKNIQNPYILLLIMFAVIALITSFFILISGWIERFFKLVFLNWINQLAGMFLAMIFGVVLLSFFIIVVTLVPRDKPFITKQRFENSAFAEVVFTIEKYTSIRQLVLKNFEQMKTRILNEEEQSPMKNP